MAWQKVKLDRFFIVKKGQAITKKESNPGIYPVILGGREPAYYIDKYNHTGKAIVVSRSGASAGYVSFWNEPIFITDGFLIEPKDDVVYIFVYYLLKYKQSQLIGNQRGAAIPHVTPNLLYSVEAFCPPLATQQKIADILSAYDNLIENNQKQIKLLEEAAQRLYKQWFIDLRYPGHETTKIVDGLPEGWRKDCIGNLIKKIERTKQIEAKDYLLEGKIPVIDQSRNFIAGYTDDLNSAVKESCPVIVFGDHTRILKYIQFPFAKGADGTQLIVSNIACMPQSLFYCSLINVDLSNYHYARHFKYLKAEEIVVPDEQIAKKFDGVVSLLFNKIQTCRNQILFAQNSRDRLLPKLMNGELEI